MLKTIIQLRNELSEKHYDDKHKPVFVCINGERYTVSTVDKHDDEVLIQTVPVENGGEVQIREGK